MKKQLQNIMYYTFYLIFVNKKIHIQKKKTRCNEW